MNKIEGYIRRDKERTARSNGINKLERYAINKFRTELKDACAEYLLHGLRNGIKKVELHFKIANVFYEFKTGKIQRYVVVNASDYRDFDKLRKIHDKISEITSHLDKYLGCKYPYTECDFDKDPERLAELLIRLLIGGDIMQGEISISKWEMEHMRIVHHIMEFKCQKCRFMITFHQGYTMSINCPVCKTHYTNHDLDILGEKR